MLVGVCYLQLCARVSIGADVLVWQTVSWLMSSCRTSLFMSTVTHLFSQRASTWNPGSLISTAAEQACTYTRTSTHSLLEMVVVRLHNTHPSETGIVHQIYIKTLWWTSINCSTYVKHLSQNYWSSRSKKPVSSCTRLYDFKTYSHLLLLTLDLFTAQPAREAWRNRWKQSFFPGKRGNNSLI